MIIVDQETFPIILSYMRIIVNDLGLIRGGLTFSHTEVK